MSKGIKHVEGRVIIEAQKEQKNYYTLSNGLTIRMERDYNNLDRSYTQQTLGMIISAENIPKGALVLFHFNALVEVNKVYNHSLLSGEEIASGIEYYSVPEGQCYLWKMPGEKDWNPCDFFEIAERVFVPYSGMIQGVEPTKMKDVLYVRSGKYQGNAVKTLDHCDAIIHFRNEEGVDESVIRFRPEEVQSEKREAEAIAILPEVTKKIKNGEYLLGITPSDAKPLKELTHA